MTPEQDERLKRIERLLRKLLEALAEEREDEQSASLTLDGYEQGAPREPTDSLG